MFFMFMFYFVYMSILSKLIAIHIHPWATCLHAYAFADSLCFNMYVYFSLYTTYIYLWRILVFDGFHVLRNFLLSLLPIFMTMSFTQNLYTHIIWGFLMILFFMSPIWALYLLSVNCWVIFMFHETYFCFISFLKDFVLVYKFFI